MSTPRNNAECPKCGEIVEKKRIKSDPITLVEYYYEWYCKKCKKYYPLIQVS